MTGVLLREWQRKIWEKEAVGGRDWSVAPTSQGPPGATRSRRGKEGLSPKATREHVAANILIADFWPPGL